MNSLGRGNDKKEKSKASVITRETVGMTLLLFGIIIFFIAVSSPYIFGDPGAAITAFFLGVFGLFFYPLDILLIYLGVTFVIGKKPIPARWILRGLFLVLCVFFLVHIATAEKYFGNGYGSYLRGCWKAAGEGAGNGTGGGVVFGIVAFPVRYLLSAPGAYVVFSLLTLLSIFLILMLTPLKARLKGLRGARSMRRVKTEGTREYPAPVGFDDLSAPSYRSMLSESERVAPVPVPTVPEAPPAASAPAPAPAPRSLKEESRDILFTNDPASSYRNNLIFNHDSQFNLNPRRSSVGVPPPSSNDAAPQTAAPATRIYTYEPTKPDYSTPSYSERYSTGAQSSRPSMPRKITPAEKSYAPSDEIYTQTPSYRAPSAPVQKEEPSDGDYMPAPSYRAPSATEESKRDFYANDVVSPDSQSSDTEEADEMFVTPAESMLRPEEAEEQEEKRELTRDEEFRSIFSRPVEKMRTEITEPRRMQNLSDGYRSNDFSVTHHEEDRSLSFQEEIPADESLNERPRFGFGDREESEDQDEGTSRVFDAPVRASGAADLFDSDEPEIDNADYREEPVELPSRSRSFGEDRTRSSFRDSGFRGDVRGESRLRESAPVPDAPAPQLKKHVYRPYRRPSNDLFFTYDDTVTVSQEEIEHNSSVIVETLAGFRVDAEVVKVRSGSAVTRYDIDIPKNIAVRTVIKRDAEIAMRLHARDGVNIYSNSEVGAISIEVPNSKRATVGLRSVLMADEYVNAKPNSLMFAIGKDIEGRNVCGNIVKMKHILVAGSTGSGKSVCLNAMLISLICRYSPADLRLILIDPKKVEFAIYDGLPHLMINEVIADAQKAVSALNWAIKEMERRYLLFEQKTRGGINVHNLDEYNASLTEDEEKLPKIVIVVDELADLMSVAKKDIEDRIQRLAQKARAAGMHLVIATQRPSVDVITGVIKGNLPTRLAFRVIQEVDSRTILDESGAEKLLGNGDMLYRTEGMFNCLRVQGAFLSSQEVQAVIEDIKANNEAYFDDSVADYINRANQSEGGAGGYDTDADDGAVDPQYVKALAIVVKLGSASISLIQRKCSVGYNHAGKIIEWMELMGYISPFDGKAKARTVLLTKEDFESKYGSLD